MTSENSRLRISASWVPTATTFPSFENTQPIAQPFGLFHIVRRVQDGIAIIAEAAHQLKNVLARLRIDTRRWFVQQNQFGPMHQRDRQVQAALHAARVSRDPIVATVL